MKSQTKFWFHFQDCFKRNFFISFHFQNHSNLKLSRNLLVQSQKTIFIRKYVRLIDCDASKLSIHKLRSLFSSHRALSSKVSFVIQFDLCFQLINKKK